MERSVVALAKDWEVGSPCKPQFRIEANSFGSGLSVSPQRGAGYPRRQVPRPLLPGASQVTPTVGRIVHYYAVNGGPHPRPADRSYVRAEDTVDLVVFSVRMSHGGAARVRRHRQRNRSVRHARKDSGHGRRGRHDPHFGRRHGLTSEWGSSISLCGVAYPDEENSIAGRRGPREAASGGPWEFAPDGRPHARSAGRSEQKMRPGWLRRWWRRVRGTEDDGMITIR